MACYLYAAVPEPSRAGNSLCKERRRAHRLSSLGGWSSRPRLRAYYNQRRPHRALHGDTPLHAFHARLKAGPILASPPAHYRVRHDRVDKSGRVTLRYLSRLHHIGLGAAYRGVAIHILVANKNIRVIREDGSLIRELTLDPARDYQPLGAPPGPPRVATMT